MIKIKLYLEDAFNELVHKVSWPTWAELRASAIVVMVASFVIAIIIYLMDISFSNLMKFIYSMFY